MVGRARERRPGRRDVRNVPCFCMTDKTLTTTLEAGLMSTCLLPRRSALTMLFKQSLRTETRVILEVFAVGPRRGSGLGCQCSCR